MNTIEEILEALQKRSEHERLESESRTTAANLAIGAQANIDGLKATINVNGNYISVVLVGAGSDYIEIRLDQARGLAGWLNHHVGCTGKSKTRAAPEEAAS